MLHVECDCCDLLWELCFFACFEVLSYKMVLLPVDVCGSVCLVAAVLLCACMWFCVWGNVHNEPLTNLIWDEGV